MQSKFVVIQLHTSCIAILELLTITECLKYTCKVMRDYFEISKSEILVLGLELTECETPHVRGKLS